MFRRPLLVLMLTVCAKSALATPPEMGTNALPRSIWEGDVLWGVEPDTEHRGRQAYHVLVDTCDPKKVVVSRRLPDGDYKTLAGLELVASYETMSVFQSFRKLEDAVGWVEYAAWTLYPIGPDRLVAIHSRAVDNRSEPESDALRYYTASASGVLRRSTRACPEEAVAN